MEDAFICPICGKILYRDVISLYHCENRHYFDIINGHLVQGYPKELYMVK
jgi:hypothetical protein